MHRRRRDPGRASRVRDRQRHPQRGACGVDRAFQVHGPPAAVPNRFPVQALGCGRGRVDHGRVDCCGLRAAGADPSGLGTRDQAKRMAARGRNHLEGAARGEGQVRIGQGKHGLPVGHAGSSCGWNTHWRVFPPCRRPPTRCGRTVAERCHDRQRHERRLWGLREPAQGTSRRGPRSLLGACAPQVPRGPSGRGACRRQAAQAHRPPLQGAPEGGYLRVGPLPSHGTIWTESVTGQDRRDRRGSPQEVGRTLDQVPAGMEPSGAHRRAAQGKARNGHRISPQPGTTAYAVPEPCPHRPGQQRH